MTKPQLLERIARYPLDTASPPRPLVSGRLVRSVGLTLEVVGLGAALGECCLIESANGQHIEAEVVGFDEGKLFLMPMRRIGGLKPGARVLPGGDEARIEVGDALLGRVIDGLGLPLDGLPPPQCSHTIPFAGPMINPLRRLPVREPLDVGIRAINGLLTVGRGQRLGLFAGSGVGKSVLLGMMTRFTTAQIVVVGLVGERGREVREFIEHNLGAEGLARAVVVAAPADESPVMRLRAARLATRIAEHFRDQGHDVLLLLDSLTRFAQAQREVALAVGEPPATRGYPPSVFAQLPELVERAGNGDQGGGSITAFYTVLMEGDDDQDPVADSARAILDGHVLLARRLAEEGHYPAIDIEASISRVQPQVVSAGQLAQAQRFKQLYSAYQRSRELIQIGAYQRGADADTDLAIQLIPQLRGYLRQGLNESFSLASSSGELEQLFNTAETAGR